MLSPQDVRNLARNGRVAPSPRYHGRSHGVRFEELEAALANCARVEKDRRVHPDGSIRHPKGFVAWGYNWGQELYRVDFDLESTPTGETILVVTGVKVK